MKVDQDILKEIDAQFTRELKSSETYMMEKLRKRLDQERYTFQRFNGLFGGKNNRYVDSVRTQFSDFNDFYSQWLKGLVNQYKRSIQYGPQPNHNAKLLKDPEIESYVRLFLERNFYRNLRERTRNKPEEQLWSVWFGYNVIFGLLIAPLNVGGKWIIDKSEIRRAEYEYWTLGHVFKVGLIDNDSTTTFNISNFEEFKKIYLSIFKKLSNSKYEKLVYERYIKYLSDSNNIDDEPFLIPEVRYAGFEHEHKYRLDFTILNPHTQQYIGFEISPSSSHMNIQGYKEKQKEVNEELSMKWNKEMTKRNEYFNTFGITTITFTEKMLENFDNCWGQIEKFLKSRSPEKTSIQDQLLRIKKL